MREIERTTQFRRDYKRKAKGRHRASLADDLTTALPILVCDRPLPVRYRDHALGGEWQGFRDCHVRLLTRNPTRQSAIGPPLASSPKRPYSTRPVDTGA